MATSDLPGHRIDQHVQFRRQTRLTLKYPRTTGPARDAPSLLTGASSSANPRRTDPPSLIIVARVDRRHDHAIAHPPPHGLNWLTADRSRANLTPAIGASLPIARTVRHLLDGSW